MAAELQDSEQLQPAPWNPAEGRRERICRWILEHIEFDYPSTKGTITINIGRDAGSGRSACSALYTPSQKPERI